MSKYNWDEKHIITFPEEKVALSTKDLHVYYGKNESIKGIDMQFEKNKITALIGPSGSGKSTYLRSLNRMNDTIDIAKVTGQILYQGIDVNRPEINVYEMRKHIGMVFQRPNPFAKSIYRNITFAHERAGVKDKKVLDEIVETSLRQAALWDQVKDDLHKSALMLSGGQQQRIALARSLAKRPKILLLDEPLGVLDKKLRQQTQLELVNTLEQVGVTCIMVTHDQEEAMTMATRIAIMSEGQLQQVGTPSDVYDYPNSRFTAEFIGETNIFDGVVVDDRADFSIVKCDGLENHVRIDHGLGGPSEQDIWVSIRPEDIDLYKEKPDHLGSFNWAKGTVEEIAYLGSFAIYHIKLANGRVVKSQVPAPYWYVRNITPPTWDETVYISWPENQPTPLFR